VVQRNTSSTDSVPYAATLKAIAQIKMLGYFGEIKSSFYNNKRGKFNKII
jgi:hypothetical protein